MDMTEDRVKNLCREAIDADCEKFCIIRHQPIMTEVATMKEDNVKRDGKLDSIHRLAYGIMGGIIVSLVVQVLSAIGK